MNTSFERILIDDDKRAIMWIPDGDIKLRPKTFIKTDIEFLQKEIHLFARKFDDNVDGNVIDFIKTHHDEPFKIPVKITEVRISVKPLII
jgi:hypothetical protein